MPTQLATSTVLVATFALGLPAIATPAVAGDRAADRFFDRVQPLLASRCVSCHGPDKQGGGLRLDSAKGVLAGGDGGPAVVPGDPDASPIVRAVRHTTPELKMPPKERLKDVEVAEIAAWVREGAVWPATVQVLFEDDPALAPALAEGSGSARLDPADKASGRASLAVVGQRHNDRVGAWKFPIREMPRPGEYRYLRFSWRKRGGAGAMMVEAAADGRWRSKDEANAAWVAGPNTTGRAAHALADTAPGAWTTVTRDLWADGLGWKDWDLTGLGVTAIDGGEVGLDAVILGPDLASLDAYAPGRGQPAFPSPVSVARQGDAWSDPANPIRAIFRGERLDLWSLRKAVRPPLPEVRDPSWVRNPIDRFILARLEREGLRPSPEADRRALLRRLSYDLIGLPPTPEEVREFVEDGSPDAYETQVDRLLASPHYGERWGRRWLDVVRYADTNGFERDEFRPEIWRYRDYVIRSLNADTPFDRFVLEQLAGDELGDGPPKAPDDVDRWLATGFLRLGPFDSTGSIFNEESKNRDELMGDLANTTGSAFLGLTTSCCQCHDHKYDPLSQADHFRLRAFFAAVAPKDDLAIDSPAEQAAIRTHNAAIDAEIKPKEAEARGLVEEARRRASDARKANLPEEILDLLAADPSSRDEATKERLKPYLDAIRVDAKAAVAALGEAERKRHESLTREVEAAKARKRKATTAMVATDTGRAAPRTQVFYQGDFTQPRDEVSPGFPSVLDPNPATIESPATETTGRRTALARWIGSRDNPWTARAIVNRLWLGHYGQGIVATPNDLGYSGARPTHPELLDWLAVELVDRGWSLKAIHRLMVTSASYRQASAGDPARHRADPDNALLWRQNVQRLDAETIRDALLAVSGRLLPDRSGRPRWPPVPDDILEAQPAILEARHGGDGGRLQDWYAEPVESTDVRSVFLIQKRSVPVPLLGPFDLPDTTVSCARRSTTTVAPQALTLLNNPDVLRIARAFADRAAAKAGDDRDRQAVEAFRFALARPPDDEEQRMAVDLLGRHAVRYEKAPSTDGRSPGRRALADLCRAIMNLNEFLYID